MFLDERKRVEERERFIKSIIECEQHVDLSGYTGRTQFNDFFKEQKPELMKYFGLRKQGNQYLLLRDNDEIEKTLKRMGMFVLITNTTLSASDVLRLYRDKDGVEKCKNTMALKRLRIHSQQALEGLLFIDFLSLILYAYILRVLRERKLNKAYTIPEILFELKKLRKIYLGRKKTIITELSKRQRGGICGGVYRKLWIK